MGHTRRKKDKLPKDVNALTADDVMKKVFPKKVAERLKEAAKEAEKRRKD